MAVLSSDGSTPRNGPMVGEAPAKVKAARACGAALMQTRAEERGEA
jgi:hypothetical protein